MLKINIRPEEMSIYAQKVFVSALDAKVRMAIRFDAWDATLASAVLSQPLDASDQFWLTAAKHVHAGHNFRLYALLF